MPSGRLGGEIALVTGSTSGLGKSIASHFAQAGATVIITGRDVDRGASVAQSIEKAGGQALFIAADVTDHPQRQHLVQEAEDRCGPISVLVNNAFGLSERQWMGPLSSTSPEAWRSVMNVGVDAVAFICQAVIPSMLSAGRGSIVNISSRTAERTTPGTAAYTVAKGAIVALTRSITADYTALGIRCNAILPGYILHEDRDTAMSADERRSRENTQLTRLSTAHDVALAALFLASDESATIAGISLLIDGGQSAVRGATLG
jgi:NAD(P)-dependent dehydrogenase (short-subunit alcohol dehydrogenase family)